MQAMYQALTMTPEERARRAKEMADGIRREDISNWLCLQIEDLAELI